MGRFEKILEKSGKRVLLEPSRKVKNSDGTTTQLYRTKTKSQIFSNLFKKV